MMSSCDSCFTTLHMPFAADMLSWLSESLAEPETCIKDMTAVNASTPNSVHDLVTNTNNNGGTTGALRLPLMQPSNGNTASGGHHTHAHAVFMYSTAADGNVTLQLRDTCSGDDCTDIVARNSTGEGGDITSGVTTLSISYQDIATDLLGDANGIDMLLGAAPCEANGSSSSVCTATLHAASVGDDSGPGGVLDLFDSSSGGPDLTLSPQTFTSSTEAFINDNSDSLGVHPDTETVNNTEEPRKSASASASASTSSTSASTSASASASASTSSTSASASASEAAKLSVKRARPKAASPNRQGPQQCQVCSKVFGNASALAKHKLTHSDERKYVCTMCGKAFKRQDHLNGHMLTHRNKKPYECKAEGCGKSYCDARSLRRHTENHHSTPAGAAALISGNATVSTSTLSPAQGAASGDAASPHGAASSTCIQYAPPPSSGSTSTETRTNNDNTRKNNSSNQNSSGSTSTSGNLKSGKSQLQQLLASEPTTKSGASSLNNDGLTKQQLDLIHQIMEQTQRQSQTSTTTSKTNNAKTVTQSKPKLFRSWSSLAQNNTTKSTTTNTTTNSNQTVTTAVGSQTTTTSTTSSQQIPNVPKPVECNLCHRKFKNIPALNGHMRLHGGYFKKDAENKKCEKKETVGPPLQTASVSVRALIEEKIINKRTTNPQPVPVSTNTTSTVTTENVTLTTARSPATSAPPLFPLTNTTHSTETKVTPFVMPAPPTPNSLLTDKTRRNSDTEKFTIPKSLNTQQEAEALADLILKRNTKAVKRTISESGQLPSSSISSQQQLHQIQQQSRIQSQNQQLQQQLRRQQPQPQQSQTQSEQPQEQPLQQQNQSQQNATSHQVQQKRQRQLQTQQIHIPPQRQRLTQLQDKQQLQIQFDQTSDTFSLAGVTFPTDEENDDYFSPSLQDEVFHQVQDSMLLQGVDAAQLAESIQLQANSLLQGQSAEDQLNEIANLEEYANVTASLQDSVDSPSYPSGHTVNQELQAVLDSPLPESLAEFSTYHSTALNSPKDVLNHYASTQSPMQYSNSPHPSLAAQSPLQSPLIRHDSPGFAYPTPPASHEGQSPGFASSHLLPMLSPQNSDSFAQAIANHSNRDINEPPQASSPLSAAFYTSTMSSAAAVEEALEEVLPGETIAPDDVYTSLTNSPPPQSPTSINMTPIPSPMPQTIQNVNINQTTTTQIAFPMSPHYTLQSQMMPNSDDPLLSSNPKDFAARKRFEFGGFQSFKIVARNGLVDLGNPPLTGILVDSNGELKFIQTTNPFAKNIVVTSTGALNAITSHTQTATTVQIIQPAQSQIVSAIPKKDEQLLKALTNQSQFNQTLQQKTNKINKSPQCTVPGKLNITQRPKLHIAVDNLKQEEPDDVFLSPTTIPASPIRSSRKRPRSEPPLTVPIIHQSRLRASRGRPPGAAPYTPGPMLNPSRNGPGLYAHAKWKATNVNINNSRMCLSSNHILNRSKVNTQEKINASILNEAIPESDSTPHINLGTQYQCSIPPFTPPSLLPKEKEKDSAHEHLLWNPNINSCYTDAELNMYLELACCAAVPGGGRNKEYALHLLYLCGGDIHEAMVKLMEPLPTLPNDHPLLSYQYCDGQGWSQCETEAFHRALLKYNKDFYQVAKEIKTKSTKECVQFYYIWKKVCADEYKRIRASNTHCHNISLFGDNIGHISNNKLLGVVDCEQPLVQPHPQPEHRTFSCEYADCSASFNSRAALNGHIRIHGGTVRRSPTPNPNFQPHQHHHHHHHHHASSGIQSDIRKASLTQQNGHQNVDNRNISHDHQHSEEFPCKVCGKVFSKIKSRSAHMKSHRPPDAEPRRQPQPKYNLNTEVPSSSSSSSSCSSSSNLSTISTYEACSPVTLNTAVNSPAVNSPLVSSSQ